MHRALEAQIEEKEAAIAQAQSGGGKQAQTPASPLPAEVGSPAASAESARGGLPKDSPEDLDRLVKEWLAKVQDAYSCQMHNHHRLAVKDFRGSFRKLNFTQPSVPRCVHHFVRDKSDATVGLPNAGHGVRMQRLCSGLARGRALPGQRKGLLSSLMLEMPILAQCSGVMVGCAVC